MYEKCDRIDIAAPVTHSEMQVRRGNAPGRPRNGYRLVNCNTVAGQHEDLREVAVSDLQVTGTQADIIAQQGIVARLNRTIRHSIHCVSIGAQVNACMKIKAVRNGMGAPAKT